MRKTKNLKALAGVATAVAALSIGGAVTAQAAPHHAPTHSTSSVHQQKSDGDGEANDATEAKTNQKSDGDGEANDATEAKGATETNDGPDQGPDANPNQPGHQDANETGEAGN